ncbi:hypothetical protein PHYPSEUDO_014438 [Phytophthora pseudosyringae]|uniref:Uncharacterized protein n=1 Tax=Phytophthora pseudosyringae TaxID=221518 RepID=A0A8T1V550_9STRA|nr:hypothetical protein PHYPSEUDO_014438 [Phytophthora pseudosyringae]
MIRGRKWYIMDYIYENSNYLNHHGKNRRCNPNGTTRQFPSADFVDKDKLEKMKELSVTRNPRQVALECNFEPTECVKDKVKLAKRKRGASVVDETGVPDLGEESPASESAYERGSEEQSGERDGVMADLAASVTIDDPESDRAVKVLSSDRVRPGKVEEQLGL